MQSNNGRTALASASGKGHREIVELLLANGADVNANKNNGETALMAASQGGHREVVELLLAKGAEVNFNGAKTALIFASRMATGRSWSCCLQRGPTSMARTIRQNRFDGCLSGRPQGDRGVAA